MYGDNFRWVSYHTEPATLSYVSFIMSPVGWGSRIHSLHLYKGKRQPTSSVLDRILNHQMARFQPWRFGECGVLLHRHNSRVYSNPEWWYLIGSYL